MTSRAEMTIFSKHQDIATLECAVAVIRRRKIDPCEMSRAAFCRVLLNEIDAIQTELRELRHQRSSNG